MNNTQGAAAMETVLLHTWHTSDNESKGKSGGLIELP